MKFLTGKDYDHLCKNCQNAIDLCLELVTEGPDTDNIEAPFDFAADHRLLCGGRTCAGGFEPGQVCIWRGMYYDAVVRLESVHKTGGFWLAKDKDGVEVYPNAEELDLVTEESPIAFRHVARLMQMRQRQEEVRTDAVNT